MKLVYLFGSVIFTVLILILAFGNIGATCSNMFFFFFPIRSNPTIITLTLAALGIITGAMYHAFIARVMSGESSDEEEDF